MRLDRKEWLEERKKGIGGSDAGAICGMNKWRGPFEVYADKLSLIPEKEDNEPMRLGRDLEEYVAQRFCEATGKKVRRKNDFIRNPDYPFAFANVDRLIVGERAGLECKTANTLSMKRFLGGEYPEEYYCQCMHYMAVTGYDRWYLAVLIYGKGLEIFEIERDENEIAALMSVEKDFWENNVLKKIPPLPSGSDTEAVHTVYAQSARDSEIALVGLDDSLKRRSEIKELIKKLENELYSIENEIKVYMGENEIAENDRYKVTWKQQTRSCYDINRFIEETGYDLSEYEKVKTFRTLKVKEIQ